MRFRERAAGSARSENPCTCGIFLLENREIRASPVGDGPAGRTGKAGGRTPMMHDARKSDGLVVCAGQRTGQEGSSPSGPRMRGTVSKGGGNASPVAGERYGDT